MNRPNYCPVNSITQVAGQFSSEAYLFVCTISKSTTPRASQHVSGDHLFKSSVIKTRSRVFIGEQILLVTPIISVPPEEFSSPILAFKFSRPYPHHEHLQSEGPMIINIECNKVSCYSPTLVAGYHLQQVKFKKKSWPSFC